MIASDAVAGPSQSDTTALVSKVRGSTSAETGCWPAPVRRADSTAASSGLCHDEQHPQRPATGSYADLSARSMATSASMSSRAWRERIGSM